MITKKQIAAIIEAHFYELIENNEKRYWVELKIANEIIELIKEELEK